MINLMQSKTVKITMAATIAVLISTYLELDFAVTAGIIAILSIQDTKREALLVGSKRIIASSIAIILSFALYVLLGNNSVVFGVFLLVFIPITNILKINEGMVVGAVLSTHLLISTNINIYWIINEVKLTIIGIGVAMIFNLYTKSLEEDFEKNKESLEEKYRLILSDMAESLVSQAVPIYDKKILLDIEELIKNTKLMAQIINNNHLFKTNNYYVDYIDMRLMQLDAIKRMKRHFSRFYMTYEQTRLLSVFTNDVAINIREDNDCIKLIDELDLLRKYYKMMELPKNRIEFENRALLFQFLNDLEDFLVIKKEFKEYSNNFK
ncbi:aromatic acid exporter family protein [Clostridium lacusfryxellense]|uniref:aromatic acid exporter family protein n=1 Tax=Clostridium lacusfryxellense TaxID=205328 RepID=UPI001C0C04D5|nr:aromatic acid exporter family protein [Clostridium lacusfryxellense]MBU3113762.1 aromatic acid exporter family protein [Clostridium lacusfryxellense]